MLNNTTINNATYLRSLEKLKKSNQYIQNQIDCIKNVLINHGYVPEKLLDWLIQSVTDNVKMECAIEKKN